MMQTDLFSAELQAALNHLPSGLAVYRLDGGQLHTVFRNTAFYQTMGYCGEHLAKSQAGEIFVSVDEEDRPALMRQVFEVMRDGGALTRTLRIFHDRSQSYRWIRLNGSRQRLDDGSAVLYIVCTDVTEERQLEAELTAANEKMRDIVNAIPGGVAVYRMTDIFETVYFSDGVPELTGYTVEEYRELIKRDAAEMTYPEDTAMVVAKVREAVRRHTTADFEFRKRHRDGHIVWVHIQARQIGESEGAPLLHCVFHNISELKETQLEMNHLINATSGGVASYRVENGRFIPAFYSDGVSALSGYSREEFEEMIQGDAFNAVYQGDLERVTQAAREAVRTGEVLNISYRTRHRDGSLVWVHVNGRRIGPLTESSKFYASFTGLSAETRMYQEIANEAADAIYVVDRSTYELLYFHEAKQVFAKVEGHIGGPCYGVLQGRAEPCPFCMLFQEGVPGKEREVVSSWNGRTYSLRFRETDWNGIPAYIQYLRDVTEETETRREKERLEQYFQTLVESLPGGVAVVRMKKDGHFVPEFLSTGFAAMLGVTLEEAHRQYQQDAMAGVHPEDVPQLMEQLRAAAANSVRHCELTYRLQNGTGGYIYVKNTLSMLPSEDGDLRHYMFLRDVTEERSAQNRIREQYKEMLMQHHRTPGPNALMVGHCNITRDVILEVNDYTGTKIVESFDMEREAFFTAFSDLIVDAEERQKFLGMYLNEPMLAAYGRQETEQVLPCFIQLPGEATGRYVQCKVSLVKEPDTGDITGVLTVTDITEQTIFDQVLLKLSNTGYDHIVVLDLVRDRFEIFTRGANASCVPLQNGSHSQWTKRFLSTRVLPKDQENYRKYLEPSYISNRLAESGTYTFDFSITDDDGSIRVKRMTVFAIDLRLGRVCLARTDVTESVREQQSLLNMLAYTFELASFIDVSTRRMVMHTHQTVLEDLSPYTMEDYDAKIAEAVKAFGSTEAEREEIHQRLKLNSMIEALRRQPAGYDFVCAHQGVNGPRYKKINILWGDRNHQTVCVVRADVTEMLAAERENKRELERALALAEQANQAKTAFLSSMSHDIRTPMNAIMGMTTLASAHMDDPAYVEDCLGKIAVSSRHLLNLINDILEMSKIERATVELNRERVSLRELMGQVATMIRPQAEEKGQRFQTRAVSIDHPYFYGDPLRVNQILINILGNAVKFTPEGGSVDLLAEECPAAIQGRVRYRFSIRDTGIGMSEETLSHIFEPFTRGTDVERIEGTGLGMSITKGLVDQMGGAIFVESRVNEGSTFRVELEFEISEEPVGTRVYAADRRTHSPVKDGDFLTGRRFLIAEDNEINAEILVSLLKMLGADAEVKTDGAQAVRAFATAPAGTYDAVLMDIQMPVMNGYEAARAVRSLVREDARAIPIIAMTANAFAEDVQAALEAGMNAHVAKPIDFDVLKETLRAAL